MFISTGNTFKCGVVRRYTNTPFCATVLVIHVEPNVVDLKIMTRKEVLYRPILSPVEPIKMKYYCCYYS